MEQLSRHQLALLCRDALSREPAAHRCAGCGAERTLGWDFDLVCPACGTDDQIHVRLVRSAGQRWEAVDALTEKVMSVGDTIEAAFNRTIRALPADTATVVVVAAPTGISALAYPTGSERPQRGMPSNEEVRAASHLGVRGDE